MFRFIMGVLVGFLGVWLFGGMPTEAERRRRAKEMGQAAQRTTQQMAAEARRATEGGRGPSVS